jgi:phosphoserine phosphatase
VTPTAADRTTPPPGSGEPRFKTVVLDVDSTLTGIEGIDWLAALRGDAVARDCAQLTDRAMAGELPIEAVYMERLQRIRPTAGELLALADAYLHALQPGAAALIAHLHERRVHVHLVSGGLRPAIMPLALKLGIAGHRVHAVSLTRDADGTFSLLDGEQPLATQRGKPLVIQQLALRRKVVMVGDGSTDAAVRGVVDEFIAYTGVARRENAVKVADHEAISFAALGALLFA